MAGQEEVNELIREILQRCQCLQYLENFKEVTKSAFRQLSEDEIKTRLPSSPAGLIAARKIHEELTKFISLQDAASDRNSQDLDDNNECSGENTVKSEHESSDDSSSYDSDGPSLFPAETVSRPKTVVEVSLDSDEEEAEGGSNNEPEPAVSRGDSSVRQSSRYSLRQRSSVRTNYYDSDEDEPASKKSKDEGDEPTSVVCVRSPIPLLKRLRREPDYIDQCSHLALYPENDFDDPHTCKLDDALEVNSKHWFDFYKKFGPSVYSLELRIWSWKSSKSKCPFNLMKILTNFCPNLGELSIKFGAVEGALDNVSIPRMQSLPKLKKISISHTERLLYKSQLKSIVESATNLESFQYQFNSHGDANDALDILENVTTLKTISLRSFARDGFIKGEQVEKIARLDLRYLEELELGNGLWEDVSCELFENLLMKSPRLKTLKIYGNYQGNSLHKPDITIKIPPLQHLETIDIGGNYDFASVDESSEYKSQDGNSNGIVTIDDDDENLKTDLFSVSLKFPLLPQMKTLILGNLFKIDELHFSSFPKLESLRVGSPWHLTVKFPQDKESRKYSYPLVTELQLPDCLKDHSFVQKIPERFPSLKKCWIFLPSVKVLRTFFRSMESSVLEELYLKTQFDFEATMELCLLGRPSQAPRSYSDYMKHEELEEYSKFQEFVSFYNVELPPKKAEDVRELEDPTCAGLAALKSLKILHLEHVPRILRIPRGNLHWTHTNAKFTGDFIGFKRYPLSRKCIEALPLQNLLSCQWPNFDVYLRDTQGLQNAGFVDLDGDSDIECNSSAPSTSKAKRKSARGEKLKVQIHPAMLQANIKFTQKDEKP